MISMSSNSKLVTGAVCALALAACDSITTADQDPPFATPTNKVVLNGSISGLSATRPIELSVALTNNGLNSGVTTRTVVGTNVLRFGAVDIGAGYDITVSKTPWGSICTVANGSGTAMAEVNNVTVTCVPDPAVTPYTLTANIHPSVANATPFPPNFKIMLATENGVETISPTPGQTSVTFSSPILASGSNLPIFTWNVTASTQAEGGPVTNCAVTGPSNVLSTGTVAPVGNVPGAGVAAPTVTSCSFTIGGTVGYSHLALPSPPAPPYTAKTITGLQLGLKANGTSEVIETLDIPAFTAATATSTTPFTFATPRVSTTDSLYEVLVTTQPTGQFCTVANGGTASLMVRPSVTTSTSYTPPTQPASISNISVRCRNVPSDSGVLTGTYQVVGTTSSNTTVVTFPAVTTTVVTTTSGIANANGTGTATTTIVDGGTPAVVDTAASAERRFLTFFANGSFLFGVHGASTAASGVEHGFYVYDPVAARIYFTITTDTNGGAATSAATMLTTGLSGNPGPAATNLPTMANVVKTADTITGEFGPAGSPATVNRVAWTLREPAQSLGEISGAWATADSKRVFVYSKTGQRVGFHMGVNGAPNLQEACFAIEDVAAPTGFYARRGGDTGCLPGTYNTFDVPNATSTPQLWPGYSGRLPGSQSTTIAVPSPVYFTVTAGNPDTLSLQGTLNDIPVGPPVVFTRSRPN